MTRKEAVKIIDCYDLGFYDLSGEKIPADKLAEAFYVATEALQTPPISQRSMYQAGYRQAQEDRPRGEWISKEELIDAINYTEFVYDGDKDGHKEHDLSELVRVIFKDIIDNLPSANMRGENK